MALLIIIAILQLIPPKVVGIIVDGVTTQRFTTERLLMWVGTIALIAVVVYLLRYVWRVLLFGASYQLAVELREDYYRQLSRQHPEVLSASPHGRSDGACDQRCRSVVFAAGEGADAGRFAGNGMCGADRDVNADKLAVDVNCAAADVSVVGVKFPTFCKLSRKTSTIQCIDWGIYHQKYQVSKGEFIGVCKHGLLY